MKKIIFVCLLLMGCTYQRASVISTTSLGPKEHLVATVFDQADASYIFMILPMGGSRPTVMIEQLLKKYEADAMVNVFVDQEVFFLFPLYKNINTRLSGTLIKYDAPSH